MSYPLPRRQRGGYNEEYPALAPLARGRGGGQAGRARGWGRASSGAYKNQLNWNKNSFPQNNQYGGESSGSRDAPQLPEGRQPESTHEGQDCHKLSSIGSQKKSSLAIEQHGFYSSSEESEDDGDLRRDTGSYLLNKVHNRESRLREEVNTALQGVHSRIESLKLEIAKTSETAKNTGATPLCLLERVDENSRKIAQLDKQNIKMEISNISQDEDLYEQLNRRYPSLLRFSPLITVHPKNPSMCTIIFHNEEIKKQFLKTKNEGFEARINEGGGGCNINDHFPRAFHYTKFMMLHFAKQMKKLKMINKSSVTCDRVSPKLGVVPNDGNNRWKFTRKRKPTISDFEGLPRNIRFKEISDQEYMRSYPHYLKEIILRKHNCVELGLKEGQRIFVIHEIWNDFQKSRQELSILLAQRKNLQRPTIKDLVYLTEDEYNLYMSRIFPHHNKDFAANEQEGIPQKKRQLEKSINSENLAKKVDLDPNTSLQAATVSGTPITSTPLKSTENNDSSIFSHMNEEGEGTIKEVPGDSTIDMLISEGT